MAYFLFRQQYLFFLYELFVFLPVILLVANFKIFAGI